MSKLTDKQEKFCREYLIDLNGTQAAIRAGYSERTANRIATENLSKPVIQEYIQELQRKDQEEYKIEKDRIVREIETMAFGRPEKDSDKLKALDMLIKMFGYDAPKKVDLSGEIKIPNFRWGKE